MSNATEPTAADMTAGVGEDRPNGPVAAILLATGIGSLVLGIMVIAAEASESFKESIAYSEDVGPLSGKTIWGSLAFFVSWAILALVLRGRDVNMRVVLVVSGILIGLGLLFTFPTFFLMFAPDE